ncbi:MAG TPA: hypothetical protein VFB76_06660 [Candidatus Angelobacter sp.]|nr:hypothetical protein [Candidatus Angelobacter sp.]
MKALGRFLKNGWLLILLVLSFIAAIISFYLQRHNPQQLQNVGVIASFVIAGLLAGVTWQYARATEKTLDLYREQWALQRAIHIRFGLKKKDGRARVWVRNLGTVHFMITKVVIQAPQSKPRSKNMHMLVYPVRMAEFFIPDDVWRPFGNFCDIDVTLFYESASQPEQSCSKAFGLELIPGNPKQVQLIKRGIRDWTVFCPKCKRDYAENFSYMTFHGQMNTRGLDSFAQAFQRAAQMEADYERTCPNHSSLWNATQDDEAAQIVSSKSKETGFSGAGDAIRHHCILR